MIERFEQLLKVSKTLTVLQSEGVRDKTLAEYLVSLCAINLWLFNRLQEQAKRSNKLNRLDH